MDEGRGGPASTIVRVLDMSSVGEARRAAVAIATAAALDENVRSDVAIVATELATNLARHAKDGALVMRAILVTMETGAPEPLGIELLSLDRGPGIVNLPRAMTDGFSTGGTPGSGLGAIQRLSHEFDLSSAPGTGTAIVSRFWAGRQPPPLPPCGVVCVPLAGERACGDGWVVLDTPQRTLIVVVDGLGHGPDAARAADTALQVVRDHPNESPTRLLQLAHAAMRPTRGGALAVAELPVAEAVLRFAGVGNIAGSIVAADGVKSLASRNGTVGHTPHSVHEYGYPCPSGAVVVLHSDGLQTRWRLDSYPGLALRHPALIAGVLHRDFARGRDDATTIVVRAGRPVS